MPRVGSALLLPDNRDSVISIEAQVAPKGHQPQPTRGARVQLVPQTLKRNERIRRRPEYQRIQKNGIRTHGRYLTLLILPNDLSRSRLGVTASRRLGRAVLRNRAKRLARELFRRTKSNAGLDVIVLPRREFLNADFASLESDYRSTLSRHGRRQR